MVRVSVRFRDKVRVKDRIGMIFKVRMQFSSLAIQSQWRGVGRNHSALMLECLKVFP